MKMSKLKLIVLLGVLASYSTSCSTQNNVTKTPPVKNTTKPNLTIIQPSQNRL